MSKLEPTYLRYIYDSLIEGSIHPENAAELPDGLIGLYEDAFNERNAVFERQKLLKRFAIWALLKKEVSAAFVAEVLSEPEADILNFISTYSAWFNSPESGKYQLYHERLKLYLLQKLSEEEIHGLHEKFISRLEHAIKEQKADEFEWYGLEFLAGHLSVAAMLNGDGEKLVYLSYSKVHWKRQIKMSKGYSWTKNGLKLVMKWASKFNDDEVVECGLQTVTLLNEEQNSVPEIVELVAQGEIDLALMRISDFGGNDKEDLQRKFILYMLCLLELTFGETKNESFKKEGICKFINRLEDDISCGSIDWHYVFPASIVLKMSCEWSLLNIATDFIFSNYKNILIPNDLNGISLDSESKISRITEILISSFDDSVDLLIRFSRNLFEKSNYESSISVIQIAIELTQSLNDDFDYRSRNFSEIACHLFNIGQYQIGDNILVNEVKLSLKKANASFNIAEILKKKKNTELSTYYFNLSKQLIESDISDEAIQLLIKIAISNDDFSVEESELFKISSWNEECLSNVITHLLNNCYEKEATQLLNKIKKNGNSTQLKTYCLNALKISTYFFERGEYGASKHLIQSILNCARSIPDPSDKIQTFDNLVNEFAIQNDFQNAEQILFELLNYDLQNILNNKNQFTFISHFSTQAIVRCLDVFFAQYNIEGALTLFKQLKNKIIDWSTLKEINSVVAIRMFEHNFYDEFKKITIDNFYIKANAYKIELYRKELCKKFISNNHFLGTLLSIRSINEFDNHTHDFLLALSGGLIQERQFQNALLILNEYKNCVNDGNLNHNLIFSNVVDEINIENNEILIKIFDVQNWKSGVNYLSEFLCQMSEMAIKLAEAGKLKLSDSIIAGSINLYKKYENQTDTKFLIRLVECIITNQKNVRLAFRLIEKVNPLDKFFLTIICAKSLYTEGKLSSSNDTFKLIRFLKYFQFNNNYHQKIIKKSFLEIKKYQINHLNDDWSIINLGWYYLEVARILKVFNIEYCVASIQKGIEICNQIQDKNLPNYILESKYRAISKLHTELFFLENELKYSEIINKLKIEFKSNELQHAYRISRQEKDDKRRDEMSVVIIPELTRQGWLQEHPEAIESISNRDSRRTAMANVLFVLIIQEEWKQISELSEKYLNFMNDYDCEIVRNMGVELLKTRGYFNANKVLSLLESENVRKHLRIGIVAALSSVNLTRKILLDVLKDPRCEISESYHVLQLSALNQLFFEDLPEEKIQHYNHILNLQWAIDIKNQLPN